MFTSIDGAFKLSKDGNFAEEILENIGDDVKGVTIHTYSGDDCHLNCDDFVIVAVKEVSYDTHEEDTFKNGITECYTLDNDRDLVNCHIVKLKGVNFKVFKSKDKILLNNEIKNEVEYECQVDEFEKLLESVDRFYEVYKKDYFEL